MICSMSSSPAPATRCSKFSSTLGTAGHDADAIASLLVPRKWFGRDAFAGGETITVLQERHSGGAGRLHKVSIARTDKPEIAAAPSGHRALRAGGARRGRRGPRAPASLLTTCGCGRPPVRACVKALMPWRNRADRSRADRRNVAAG